MKMSQIEWRKLMAMPFPMIFEIFYFIITLEIASEGEEI